MTTTQVQRMTSLAAANEVRYDRARFRTDVAEGKRSLGDVLLDPPECLMGMMVLDVLMWQRHVGRHRAERMLSRQRPLLSPSVRVRDLSPARREQLARSLGSRS